MSNDDIKIRVSAPETRIVAQTGPISIQYIFLHDEFAVRVWLNGQTFAWHVMLPEWLEALTRQLNAENDCDIRHLLLLSGEHFESRRTGNNVEMRIFDVERLEVVSLCVTTDQARDIHTAISESFIQAIQKGAGHPIGLLGLETISLEKNRVQTPN